MVLNGPRQAGKTTLAVRLVEDLGRGTVRRLDDPGVLDAAIADPRRFLEAGERPVVLDEIQLAGDRLVRAVKLAVDRDPSPGQFVLTGSANFLTVPTISESLAGRAALLELWPLTQGEIEGHPERFVDVVFAHPDTLGDAPPSAVTTAHYYEHACRGGYPEALNLSARQRQSWFADYVATTIRRDVVELAGLRKVVETEQLLRIFAARTAGELVMQHVIEAAPLDRNAVYERLAWLETVHLIRRVPTFSRSPSTKVKRHPKLYVTDPGLAAWLLGRRPEGLLEGDGPGAGPLLETFVATELIRQAAWSDTEVAVSHWRDRTGREVDLILERPDGAVVAIEVKRTATPTRAAFRWLTYLRDRLGDRFLHGLVLHTGPDALPFGERLSAVPISSLWTT